MFNDNYTVSNCSGVVPALFLQGRFCRVNIMSNSCALLHHVHICTALFYWAKSCFTREAEGLLHCSRVHQRSTSWLKILLHKQSCCSNLRALKAFFFSHLKGLYIVILRIWAFGNLLLSSRYPMRAEFVFMFWRCCILRVKSCGVFPSTSWLNIESLDILFGRVSNFKAADFFLPLFFSALGGRKENRIKEEWNKNLA